jgi:hypothetical protein
MMTHTSDRYDATPEMTDEFSLYLCNRPSSHCTDDHRRGGRCVPTGGGYALDHCRWPDRCEANVPPARGGAPSTDSGKCLMLAQVPLGVMVLLAWLMADGVVALALRSTPVDVG